MSSNQVQNSSFSLEGGRDNKEEWHDKWEFKRVSWMQELTLMVDFYYAELPADSKFNKWLSISDKKIVDNCRDFFYAMLYVYEPSKISENEFVAQMRAQGYDDITLNSINSQIRLHPQYNESSFARYKLKTFCSTKKSKEERLILINFPGFIETSL
jgi:hypothetical protein